MYAINQAFKLRFIFYIIIYPSGNSVVAPDLRLERQIKFYNT